MKLIKTRKNFKCHKCKKDMEKGSLYVRRSMTIGRPQDSQFERVTMATANGGTTETVAFVEHGLKIAVKVCEACAIGNS